MVSLIKEPKSVSDMVFCDAHTEKRITQYAEGKRKHNIILHGPMGTGKSATAKVIADSVRKNGIFDYPTQVYNGADFDETTLKKIERDFDFQRNADAAYVVIDEVDRLTATQQVKLRAFLDNTKIGHIIMTTNNIHNIDGPLADRCDVIEFPPIDAEQWRSKIKEWLDEEGIKATKRQIDAIIETSNGTVRDLINGVTDIVLENK